MTQRKERYQRTSERLEALNALCERDKTWFETHLKSDEYFRGATDADFVLGHRVDGHCYDPSHYRVLVCGLSESVRLRLAQHRKVPCDARGHDQLQGDLERAMTDVETDRFQDFVDEYDLTLDARLRLRSPAQENS
jgi:hypothetical protein